MRRIVGVVAKGHISIGLVENYQLVGSVRRFPEKENEAGAFQEMPAEKIGELLRQELEKIGKGEDVHAVGVGFPGIVRNGVIGESPNLQQIKGFNLQAILTGALWQKDNPVPVRIFNDADVMAAGIAATQGYLERVIRVWTLGNGIGFGRYPLVLGNREGGHSVVSLDTKEHYCGCGGKGHLEGIMGHRAMRLRFLDMEPEEVFENAKAGDARCSDFVKLWHRALAAATATNIHMDGPGKFFITGPNARFIDLGLLGMTLQEMVKMSPLQGSSFEVISTGDEIGIIGAAVNAEQATMKYVQC